MNHIAAADGLPGEYPGHPTLDENGNVGEGWEDPSHDHAHGHADWDANPETPETDQHHHLTHLQEQFHDEDPEGDLHKHDNHDFPEHLYPVYPHIRAAENSQSNPPQTALNSIGHNDHHPPQLGQEGYDPAHPSEPYYNGDHQIGSQDPYEGYRHLDHQDSLDLPPSPPSPLRPPGRLHPGQREDVRRKTSNDFMSQRERETHYRKHDHMANRDRIDNRPPSYRERDRYTSRRQDDEEWYDRPRQRLGRSDGSPPRRRQYADSRPNGPQVQVYSPAQPPPAAAPPPAAPNMGETMQMMMMSSMMQQQLQAQQMQAAQMASMMGGQKSRGGESSCGGKSNCGKKKGQGSTLVNIQGGGKRRRVMKKVDSKPVVVKKVAVPIMQPILQPPRGISGEEESGGFENWQEATIILCLMIVGMIYLVSSRASAPPPDEKKPSRHLAGAS